MTLVELRQRVRFWKRELGLLDWKIRLRQANPEELVDKHAFVTPRGDHGFATIALNPEAKCVEFWLLHEILHLVLDGMTESSYLEERAVNRIARALCRAHQISCPSEKDV